MSEANIPPRVFSGYDDDECWFPFFASVEAAQGYAENRFRDSCGPGDDFELTWVERKARTEFVGYPDMWDLYADDERMDYVVCGERVFSEAASAIENDRREEAERQRELGEQMTILTAAAVSIDG